MDTFSGRALRASLLAVALGCSGCGAAADVGGKLAVGLLEAMMKPSPSSSSSGTMSETAVAPEDRSDDGLTPCRRKQSEWRRAEGSPRMDPPPYLRCGPSGEWPDETELRTASGPPSL